MNSEVSASGVQDVYIQSRASKISELERQKYVNKSKVRLEEIDKAAQEFEAVFLSEMLQHMFAGVDINPLAEGGEGGSGDDIYKSMLVDEYGKTLSRAGGIGVAAHVKREMLRLQEVEQ